MNFLWSVANYRDLVIPAESGDCPLDYWSGNIPKTVAHPLIPTEKEKQLAAGLSMIRQQ